MNYLWGSGLGKGKASTDKQGDSDLSEDTYGRTVSPSFGNGPSTFGSSSSSLGSFGASSPSQAAPVAPAYDYSAVPAYTPPIPASIPFQSPYLNIGQIDPAVLGQAKLDTNEFLFESQKSRHRPFNEQMIMGVAAAYLGGQAVGGLWGFVEGLRHPAATSTRLKINTVLNALTKRGPAFGNAAGIVACMFGGINYALIEARKGHDDDINGVVSAVGAGALFKCTAGPRAIAISSATAAALYAVYAVGRALIKGEKITKPSDVLREKQYE